MLVLPKKEEELRAREYPWVSVSLKMMMTVMTPPTTPIMRGGVDACRKLVMWYEEARGQQQERWPEHLGAPQIISGVRTKKFQGMPEKEQISWLQKICNLYIMLPQIVKLKFILYQ